MAIEGGVIGARFQSLINPGRPVDAFIENYTGINNAMLTDAPTGAEVFPQLHDFIGDAVLVAHNASFDQNFLDCEYQRVRRSRQQPFLCSMRVARRLYPGAPNHKLGTLVDYASIPVTGSFHRALADADMTALLWLAMLDTLRDGFGLTEAPLDLLEQLQGVTIARAHRWLMAKSSEQSNVTTCL